MRLTDCCACVVGERGSRGLPRPVQSGQQAACAAHRAKVRGFVQYAWWPLVPNVSTLYGVVRSIGSATAVSKTLEVLENNAAALEYFKASIVGGMDNSVTLIVASIGIPLLTDCVMMAVLKGESLPHKAPFFGGTMSEPETYEEPMPAADETSTNGSSSVTTATKEEKFAPIFRRQVAQAALSSGDHASGSLKRSRENSPANTGERTSEGDKKAKVSSASDSRSSSANRAPFVPYQRTAGWVSQAAREKGMNPTYTIPTQWEELYYKKVQVIDVLRPGAKELIQELRFAGTPFILERHSGWMKFSEDWVKPDGKLDSAAFLRGIHDVKVPVIEKNYDNYDPIKTHLPLSYYVKNFWERGKSDYYMHQWQFPLSPKAGKLLCYKCEELPVLGDNLLLYWLDAVRGDNPLQYLFMGQKSTVSRMHLDAGGLDITIAPIIGTKRVTMLHRSAAKLDSHHDSVNFHHVDLDKSPLIAFLPAWQCDVKPGQILFMPEGTLHACENITACLSYHRFHVDSVNLPGFLASFMAQDAPVINHAEILWNATHDVMAALEENYHANGQALDDKIATLRKLDSLRALRHACRVISLEEAVPTGDTWDWTKLLEDVDFLLVRIDVRAAKNAKENSSHGSVVTAAAAAALRADESDGSAQNETESSRLRAAAKAHSSILNTASSVKAPMSAHASSTHWDSLNLKKGNIIGVQVFEKRNRAEVLKVELNKELVQIHYVDWGSIYDEFLPVAALYQRGKNGKSKVRLKEAPKVHETVMARWGSRGELYNAIVLKVIRTNACLVHYLKYEKDWDQWILPGHIFRKYESDK